MSNRSTFPTTVDTFLEHYDIQANDVVNVKRFQELKMKLSLSESEQIELSNLITTLREKIFTPEDFNKLQDCITNLEVFFRDNVNGYVIAKQGEMNTSVANGINTINTAVGSATTSINTTKEVAIIDMDDKKTGFINYVNTKEVEINTMVREFDSNSARYVQSWSATAGQVEFDIYGAQGSDQTLPPEANLNITVKDIDLIINGTTLTPTVDYTVKNDGLFRNIVLDPSNANLIGAGSEVVAKWYKNVGKLYFTHASSHRYGSSDPLTVDEMMLDSSLKNKVNNLTQKFTVGTVQPVSPANRDIWIDLN